MNGTPVDQYALARTLGNSLLESSIDGSHHSPLWNERGSQPVRKNSEKGPVRMQIPMGTAMRTGRLLPQLPKLGLGGHPQGQTPRA